MSPEFRVFEGSVSPWLPTPALGSGHRGWSPAGLAAPAEEEQRYRVPELAHSPGTAAQPCSEERSRRVLRRRGQEPRVLGRRHGGSAAAVRGCWGRALRHAAFPPPPASVRTVPASLVGSPASLAALPGRSLLPLCLFSVSLH